MRSPLSILFAMVLLTQCMLFAGDPDGPLEEFLPKKLEEYKSIHGHYPKTQSSEEIIHRYLMLNGNEYYPEYFDYSYDSLGDSYVLEIILHHETMPKKIDSRNLKPNKR